MDYLYHCIIDVEEYDQVCSETLNELQHPPPLISTEAESSVDPESYGFKTEAYCSQRVDELLQDS